ncbi:copper resistance protein CopC [Paraburkholderia sp. IMGN_8]|uniref:copper resistance CopC family protein n=1 Tax=Paraburkholderia sp. IMGN_8 TaxID=3136564 RepID=UPI0031013294
MKNSFLNGSTARGVVAALSLATSQLVNAHAYPKHQAPPPGASMSVSPKEVSIDFDDGLEAEFSAIMVTDAQRRSVTLGKAMVDSSNSKHMSVMLNPLAPGVYTVTWVAVAADGHRTEAEYTFTVK